jgi:hypothetical protein
MRTLILFCLVLVICVGFVFAQDFQPAGEEWITKWYSMGLVTNTGGHTVSATHDWLDEGTDGEITDASVSTAAGLKALQKIETINLPANGGELEWNVVTIVPSNSYNISVSHGKVDESNVEFYGIIVIDAPDARTTTMHPAHDDYAHIWLNGEKVYDNPEWTGGATIVTTPTDVNLVKGENVLLFRCGESGGDDYINLHFEATDDDLKIVPTMDDEFFKYIELLPVEPDGKQAETWGGVKQR